jgi:hypothetical protein
MDLTRRFRAASGSREGDHLYRKGEPRLAESRRLERLMNKIMHLFVYFVFKLYRVPGQSLRIPIPDAKISRP